jgi:hypothetical protein
MNLTKGAVVSRFLRNKSGLYWSQSGWVQDHTRAHHFDNMHDAVETFHREDLEDTELIIQFGDTPSQYDVKFNLCRDFKRSPDVRSGPPQANPNSADDHKKQAQ